MVMAYVTNLDRPLHCAAGSIHRILQKDVFHHVHFHALLPAHRAADHIHWNKTESHTMLSISLYRVQMLYLDIIISHSGISHDT